MISHYFLNVLFVLLPKGLLLSWNCKSTCYVGKRLFNCRSVALHQYKTFLIRCSSYKTFRCTILKDGKRINCIFHDYIRYISMHWWRRYGASYWWLLTWTCCCWLFFVALMRVLLPQSSATVRKPNLHTSLSQGQSVGELLARIHIRVLRFLKRFLKCIQLSMRELGSTSSLLSGYEEIIV